jgi:hypothetical protein
MNIFHAQYIIKDDCHFMINILTTSNLGKEPTEQMGPKP